MAIIRDSPNLANDINYVATIAFFCGISCAVLMLKFRGFKAILNLSQPKEDISIPTVSGSGAYRTNKEEFFGYGSFNDAPKVIRPSMVKLPKNKAEPTLRPSKSTNDLKTNNNSSTHLNKAISEVSLHPRGPNNEVETVQTHNPVTNAKEIKKQEKEQKKLEKKRIADQKIRDKMALEQAKKQEKLKKEREKQEAQKLKPQKKEKTKKPAPQPKTKETKQELPPRNSVESNINNSNGPPPYIEAASQAIVLKNEKDNTGNTSFSKPIDNSSSWDMISQHREQINRPVSGGSGIANHRKQKVMDLQYNFGNPSDDKENSEA
ncbi:uncharacterized protein ACR2FA_004656 [Aphomia sociella]